MIEAYSIEAPFDLRQIDKSEWQTYRFDQIAFNISERVEPQETDLKIYVGLEHLDSESLHIKRWGTPSDVEGTKLKVYPGDIIFGKRRAYQRKAALANFEGICSAHAMVLRPNPKVINPELFPFLIHSDTFMNRAIDISVGSLSPTINWKTLAVQEFRLPPKEQQAKLAQLFWAGDKMILQKEGLLQKLQFALKTAIYENCLNIESNDNELRDYKLAQIFERLEAGVSVNSEEGDYQESDLMILKTSAVSDGFFKPYEAKKVRKDETHRLKCSVKKDSIIISRMNTAELVGANAYVERDFCNLYLPDRLWQTVVTRDDVNTKFIWYILSSDEYRRKISELCSGTSNSMKNISKEAFLNLRVVLPNKALQDKAVKSLELTNKERIKLESLLQKEKQILKSIINQIFN